MADAFIIDACRTPRGIGKPGKGALAHLHPQHLGATVLAALRDRNDLDTADVDDIVWGTSSQVSEQSGDLGRMAALDGTPAVAALFARHDAVFVASLREGSAPLWGRLARPPASPLLIVGPEGDFAPGELDFLLAAGARPCRLSGPVLRAETAAAAGAAILAQAILLWTQWKT